MKVNCKHCGIGGVLEGSTGGHASCNAEARKAARTASKPKKRYSIPAVSKKGAQAKKAKNKVYQEMDKTDERYCSGCLRWDRPLSHSHLVPVGLNKALETEPENIVYDCLDTPEGPGCHTVWEHGTMKEKMQLKNYLERMSAIRRLDNKYYMQLIHKIL